MGSSLLSALNIAMDTHVLTQPVCQTANECTSLSQSGVGNQGASSLFLHFLFIVTFYSADSSWFSLINPQKNGQVA